MYLAGCWFAAEWIGRGEDMEGRIYVRELVEERERAFQLKLFQRIVREREERNWQGEELDWI